jgi:amidase
MSMDAWALADWDATETLERLKKKDVTALEVTEAAITRAEAAAPLNAIVTPAFERARKWTQKGSGPLAGVPSFIKDLVQVEGLRTGWGSAAAGHYVSKKTDPTARTLEATGFVTLGKSATPEFGLTATTEPLSFAPTLNPWNRGFSTGGSSGGAAALVAAGVVPIAHASDGGGSIRIPASCCGLVGLKPTRGRFDMDGSNLLPVNIAVNGVVSRTVRDTVLFWKAVESSRKKNALPPIGDVQMLNRKLRIGFFTDTPWGSHIDPEVRAATEETAALCRSLGHEVEAIKPPPLSWFLDDFLRLWGFVAWIQMRTSRAMMHSGFQPAKFERWSQDFAGHFASSPMKALSAVRRLRGVERDWANIMGGYDLLLSPTLALPPTKIGHLRTDQSFEVLLERVTAFTPFTALLNVSGSPGISLPLAHSKAGLPLGVHFSAKHGEEKLLLELAFQLEAAKPWTKMAPRSAWAG